MLVLNKKEILEKSLKAENSMTFKEFVSFNKIPLDNLDISEAVEIYLKYRNSIIEHKQALTIDDLKNTIDDLKNTIDKNSAVHALQLSRIESYTGYTVNKTKKFDKNPQVWIMKDMEAKDNEYNLFLIRSQVQNMGPLIKKLKSNYGENIIISFKISQPDDAVVFWKTFNQNHIKNIKKDPNSNWFSLEGLTIRQFYEKLNRMDKSIKSKSPSFKEMTIEQKIQKLFTY
jgi:hypothetical protein